MSKALAGNSPGSQDLERLEVLERQNRELVARLAEVTAAAALNDEVRRKTQEREVVLLQTTSLSQLIDLLQSGLRKSFQLDAVTLILLDPHHEMRHLLIGESASSGTRGVQFVDSMFAVAPQLASLPGFDA